MKNLSSYMFLRLQFSLEHLIRSIEIIHEYEKVVCVLDEKRPVTLG